MARDKYLGHESPHSVHHDAIPTQRRTTVIRVGHAATLPPNAVYIGRSNAKYTITRRQQVGESVPAKARMGRESR